MQKRSKRILAATLAAVGVIAAGGAAYAAFFHQQTATASGSAATYEEVTLTAEWLGGDNGPLIPGEYADVLLKIDIPNGNNVNAKITSITPVDVSGGEVGGANAGWANQCAAWIEENPYTNLPGNLVMAPNQNDVPLRLDNAIKLSADATNECSGITFPTKWIVRFDATHDAATISAAGGGYTISS